MPNVHVDYFSIIIVQCPMFMFNIEMLRKEEHALFYRNFNCKTIKSLRFFLNSFFIICSFSFLPLYFRFLPSIAGNGLLGLQLLLGTILIEYGLTSCCWVNCSSGSILTIPGVSVNVASQALRAFSKCCNASLCSIFIKFDEFGFCGTGVVLCDGALAVLVAAIDVVSKKVALEVPSSDGVSSPL